MNDFKVAGVDIGGSHITAGMVDLETGNLVKNSLLRRHVNSKGSAVEILDVWVEVIDKLFAGYPSIQKRIGIAMPGPFDYKEGVCRIKGVDKFESLFNLNIKKLLASKLQIATQNIVMMNDAVCFLKGEIISGAAANCDNVIGIMLGTGLGSARFHSGQTFEGDLYSYPFKDGVTEDYISSRWFIKKYREITGRVAANVKELNERISTETDIRHLFAEFGKNLGEVLYSYAQKYPCETFVIGGNIANAWDYFIDETKSVMKKLPAISIKRASPGEESILIGAASLWK